MRTDKPGVTAVIVQRAVERDLRKRNPNSPKGWPGVSAVDKTLRPIRQLLNQRGPDSEDRPWSLLALSFAEIPSAAVPHLVKAWGRSFAVGHVLTIREARWIGKLFPLYREDETLEVVRLLEDARHMAVMEQRLLLDPSSYPATAAQAVYGWVADLNHYCRLTGDPNVFIDALHVATDSASPQELSDLDSAIDGFKELILSQPRAKRGRTDTAQKVSRQDEGR